MQLGCTVRPRPSQNFPPIDCMLRLALGSTRSFSTPTSSLTDRAGTSRPATKNRSWRRVRTKSPCAASSQGAVPRETSPPAAGVPEPGVSHPRRQKPAKSSEKLHLSTHVSSHAMETESPPVLEPSQLITDREGLIRLATGIDQGCGQAILSHPNRCGHGNRSGVSWCLLLVVSSAW